MLTGADRPERPIPAFTAAAPVPADSPAPERRDAKDSPPVAVAAPSRHDAKDSPPVAVAAPSRHDAKDSSAGRAPSRHDAKDSPAVADPEIAPIRAAEAAPVAEPVPVDMSGEPVSDPEITPIRGADHPTSHVPEDSDLAGLPPAPDDLVVGAGPGELAGVDSERAPLGDLDYHLFSEGTHLRLWERLGAILAADGLGVHFAVWAPNARGVSVIGEWNGWSPHADPLGRGRGGVWTGFVPAARRGMHYKYKIVGMHGEQLDKADPHALRTELPPQTASVIWDLHHEWHDAAWMSSRAERQRPGAPMSIYEVHLGSWLRKQDGSHLSYRELAPRLVEHVRRLGFTHVELMPITEHPFYGSWGYQASAYYAPTSRYGSPQDLMALIDALHQADIGVILDWVPAHFPADVHGLARFDGSYLYEHADPRRGVHPDWNTLIFNLSRHEVRSFLLSSAMMWLQAFHIDGLRVDAVASMLYLDYSRKDGQWLPNHLGGRENLESIHFLRELNHAVHTQVPGAITIAEESTAWPLVSHPIEAGGLGFDFKWDMGWMHDTLRYCALDPLFRSQHHRDITFRMMYAYSEKFVLPLSHDEVVHGKGSLPIKMSPGSGGLRQRYATLRLLYAYMFGMPGKKLLFMGDEFGQLREWSHDRELDWYLVDEPVNAGLLEWTCLLGHMMREEPALHELDHDPTGFRWLVVDDNRRSSIAFVRRGRSGAALLFVVNFTPVPWPAYTLPIAAESEWTLVCHSDEVRFGGAGTAVPARLVAQRTAGEPACAAVLDLPPLTAMIFRGPDVATLAAAESALREALALEAAAAAEAEAARAAGETEAAAGEPEKPASAGSEAASETSAPGSAAAPEAEATASGSAEPVPEDRSQAPAGGRPPRRRRSGEFDPGSQL